MKVLIIDDSLEKRTSVGEAVTSIVGKKNLVIHHSGNVTDASRECSKTRFDLVILDVNLPAFPDSEPIRNGGIQLLHNLKTQKALKSPGKLVGLTAYRDDIEKYREEFEKECYTLVPYDLASIDWTQKLAAIIGQSQDVSHKDERNVIPSQKEHAIFEFLIISLILGVACLAIFRPIALTPTSRLLLFWLCGIVSGLLFGNKVSSKFSIRLPGFCFVTAGAAAVSFGCILILQHFSSQEISIGVFKIKDETGKSVTIQAKDVESQIDGNCSIAETFLKGNTLLVRFAPGSESAKILIRQENDESGFEGEVLFTPGKVQDLIMKNPEEKDP